MKAQHSWYTASHTPRCFPQKQHPGNTPDLKELGVTEGLHKNNRVCKQMLVSEGNETLPQRLFISATTKINQASSWKRGCFLRLSLMSIHSKRQHRYNKDECNTVAAMRCKSSIFLQSHFLHIQGKKETQCQQIKVKQVWFVWFYKLSIALIYSTNCAYWV